MGKGNIILINGSPSSGKSSLAKALKNTLEAPFLHMSLDDIARMLPEHISRDWEQPEHHQTIFKAVSGWHQSIAVMASIGNNLIVDHVMMDGLEGYYLAECAYLFAHSDVLFVGLSCGFEELERRELQRQDREKTFSKDDLSSMQERAHAHGVYDLEIDTTAQSPVEMAEQIKEHLLKCVQPTAFKELRDLFITRN